MANDNTVSAEVVPDIELPTPEEALKETAPVAEATDTNSSDMPLGDSVDQSSEATIEALAAEQQAGESPLALPPRETAPQAAVAIDAPSASPQQESEAAAELVSQTDPTGGQDTTSSHSSTQRVVKKPKSDRTSRSESGSNPTDVRFYTIQSGDTLGSISRLIYGKRTRWKELAAWNKIPANGRIMAGSVLKYKSDAESADFDQRWNALAQKTTKVKKHDSLSHLAKRLLGNASLWPMLWKLNEDKISNPNHLVAGTELKYISQADFAGFVRANQNLKKAH